MTDYLPARPTSHDLRPLRESDTHPKGEDLQGKAEFMSSTVDEVHSPNTSTFQSIGDLASHVLAQTKAKMEPNP